MLDWLLQACLESAPNEPGLSFSGFPLVCLCWGTTLPALAVPWGLLMFGRPLLMVSVLAPRPPSFRAGAIITGAEGVLWHMALRPAEAL